VHEFVVDGAARLRKACLELAEAEVLAAYREQLRSAGFLERRRLLRRLRRELRSEIERRAERLMPPTSPYTLF
jgi:hypothetical protein